MSTRRRYPARHLGWVEVKGSMFYLSKETRIDFGMSCYQTLLRDQRCHPQFMALQGRRERANQRGELLLDTLFLQLFVDKTALWKLKLTSVSTIVVVPGSGGIMVVLGQCQQSSRRLAVVVALASERAADDFTRDFSTIKTVAATNLRSVAPGPAPARPPKTRPPAPTAAAPPPQEGPTPDIPSPDYDEVLPPPHTRPLPEPDEQRPPALSRSASYPKYAAAGRFDRPLPTPPQTQTNQQASTPGATLWSTWSEVSNRNDRPLPTPPTPSDQRTTSTSALLPRISSMMSERTLPEPPTQQQQPEPIYNTVMNKESHYANPIPDTPSPTPSHPPASYANVHNTTKTKDGPSDTSHYFEIGDWSEDEDEKSHRYQNVEEKFYTILGIDVNDAEQMYITLSDTDKIQSETRKHENKQGYYTYDEYDDDNEDAMTEFEYKELESDTTLAEDIYFFIKDEYMFKSIIWRIREAIPYLRRDLQSLLRGTEILAGIQNDMYLELSQGNMSCTQIAQVFLSRRDQLERYKYYLLNSPKINRLLLEEDEMVKRQFPRLHKDIQTSWKRLPFYYTSLRKMETEAPKNEKQLLKTVVDLLRELNIQGDSGILLSGIRGAPFDLFECAPLLLHSSFNVKSSLLPDSRARYRVLLFQRLIVVTEPKDDGYQYQFHLDLSQLRIKPEVEEKKRTFVLQQLQGNDSVYEVGFRAGTVEKRLVWLGKIKGLIEGYTNFATSIVSIKYLVNEQKGLRRRQDQL